MSKREKILLVFVLLAGVAAAIYYLPDLLGGGQAAKKRAAREAQVSELEQNARKLPIINEIGRVEQYVLNNLRKEWQRDPFLELAKLQEAEAAKTQVGLVYQGFLSAGPKTFAIINGMEYLVGETVVDTRLRITSANEHRVVLTGDNNVETILTLQE